MTQADTAQLALLGNRAHAERRAVRRLPIAAQLGLGVVVAIGYVLVVALHAGPAIVGILAMVVLAVVAPPAGLASLAVVLGLPEPEVLSPPGVVALLLAAIVVGIVVRLPYERPTIRASPGIVLAIGYLAVSAVTLLPPLTGYRASDAASATLELIHLASGVVTFMVAVYLLRRVPEGAILAILVVGAAVSGLVAIADFASIGPILSLVDGLRPASLESRAAGFFSNSNYLGFFAAQSVVLLVAVFALARGAARLLIGAAIVLILGGLVLSFSRGGLLGLAVGLFVLLALRRPRLALTLAIVTAALLVVVYPLFLQVRLEVSAGATDPRAYLDQQRSEHWREQALGAGIQMFLSAPVQGIGFGMFQVISPQYVGFSPATYSHDQWLDLLAEQGIIGLMFMAGIIVSLVIALRRSTHRLAPAALALLAAYAAESLFINSLTSIQISGTLFLVLAIVLARPEPGPEEWRAV